jgi:hypothetical protein
MLHPKALGGLRSRRLIVSGVAIGLLLGGAVTYAGLGHRSGGSDPAHSAPSVTRPDPSTTLTNAAVGELPKLRPTQDPQVFARRVAEALFTWDTATTVNRTDHVEQLVAVADPTGQSTPGLVADIQNYLPAHDAWKELARYETRQSLSIASVTPPEMWSKAIKQAGDELLPGTSAYTIRGTRHRAGKWEGTPVTSEHDVAFTVFVVCEPSFPKCQLLRLSMLDKPLD